MVCFQSDGYTPTVMVWFQRDGYTPNDLAWFQSDGYTANDLVWFGASDFVTETEYLYPDGSTANDLTGLFGESYIQLHFDIEYFFSHFISSLMQMHHCYYIMFCRCTRSTK